MTCCCALRERYLAQSAWEGVIRRVLGQTKVCAAADMNPQLNILHTTQCDYVCVTRLWIGLMSDLLTDRMLPWGLRLQS
jgi:hypothetical protein